MRLLLFVAVGIGLAACSDGPACTSKVVDEGWTSQHTSQICVYDNGTQCVTKAKKAGSVTSCVDINGYATSRGSANHGRVVDPHELTSDVMGL